MTDPFYSAPAPLMFEGCGVEYDHDLRLIRTDRGEDVYGCRRCGDEIREVS